MTLYIIGTGPGDMAHMSKRAVEVLCDVECVAGYTTYMDMIAEIIKDKEIISTGMMKEVERVEKAIEKALSGKSCALVSGGDPGIYAMAGLVFEICKNRGIQLSRAGDKKAQTISEPFLSIEVVPGIPALAAGAALAGAPLTHDFAAISLSDLLTSWETIEKRLTCAAMADFVIVIYNPKSKKRDWQLKRAQKIILTHREGKTPVAVVTGAMRENQRISFTTLDCLESEEVSMQTVIFIGSSTSVQYLDFLFTPRGYSEKYDI